MTYGDVRSWRVEGVGALAGGDALRGMTTSSVSDQLAVVDERVLRVAVSAYLGRYRGESRVHTGSDLEVFLTWCTAQHLDPLNLGRAEIERYVRWLQQEVRRYPRNAGAVVLHPSRMPGPDDPLPGDASRRAVPGHDRTRGRPAVRAPGCTARRS